MALIGMGVGLAFMLAFVVGPALNPFIGVPGLFYLSAGLALLALIVLFSLVPTPAHSTFHEDTEPSLRQFRQVLRDKRLLHLNLSIFMLHILLMSSFVVIPLTLRDSAGLNTAEHWHIYLPVLITSVLLMLPFLLLGERLNRTRLFFTGAIAVMVMAQFGLFFWHTSTQQIALMLVMFFTGFNYLEAMLPTLISKMATPSQKGTALGIYSSSQFIGTFIGGLAGGYIYGQFE